MDEVQQLRVRVMELERGALIGARRPGDGGADEKAGLSSELSFQRSAMRQTYHFGETATLTVAMHRIYCSIHVLLLCLVGLSDLACFLPSASLVNMTTLYCVHTYMCMM